MLDNRIEKGVSARLQQLLTDDLLIPIGEMPHVVQIKASTQFGHLPADRADLGVRQLRLECGKPCGSDLRISNRDASQRA